MRILQTAIVAGLALLLIGGAWRMGKRSVMERVVAMDARTSAWMAQLQNRPDIQQLPSVQLAQKQLIDLERSQNQEWMTALGGAGGRALKDPSLSLTDMIQAWTESVVPPRSIISTQVDRFTEFSLLIELSQAPTREELALWSRSILSSLSPYLHWIRFSREGVLLASLDRRDVEALGSVSGTTSTDAILNRFENHERLMAESKPAVEEQEGSESEPQLATQPMVGDAAQDPETVRVFQMFARRFESHLQELLQIQDGLRLMRNVDEVITRVSLAARRDRLSMDLKAIESRRLLLINPALEWEQSLKDPAGTQARQSVARNATSQYQARVEGELFFDALKAQGVAVDKYLTFLHRTWGVWTVEKEGVYWVQFLDAALGREHDSLRDQVTEKEKAASKAYAEWARKAWSGLYSRPQQPSAPKTRPKELPKREP